MSINRLIISPTPSNTATNTPTITASLTACPTNTPTNTPSPTNTCCSAFLISFSNVPNADYISWYNCDGVQQTGYTNGYKNFIIYHDNNFGSIYVNNQTGYTITNIGCLCNSTCNQINITGISGESVFYKTCYGGVNSTTTPVSFCADGSTNISPFDLPISFGDTTGFTVSVECCPTPQITSSPTTTPTMTPSTTPCFNPQAFAIFDRNSLRFDLNDYMLANGSAFRGMNLTSPSTVPATFQTQMNLYIDYSGWGASNNAIMFEPTSFNEEPIDITNTNSWSDDFTWVSAFVPSCSSCPGYYEYFGEQGNLALSNTVYSSIEFYYSGNVVQQGFYRLYTTKPGTSNRYFNDNGVYTVSGLTCTGSTPTPTTTPTSTPSITSTQTTTPTNTSTPTNTPTITQTNTPSNTQTITSTPTNTETPSVSPTNTNTPTTTQTPSNTETPSVSPTQTNTPTGTPEITSTPTNTPTPSGNCPYTIYSHGAIRATCSDYCNENYLIQTITCSSQPYGTLSIGDFIYGFAGQSGYLAYSNVSTDTNTGPFIIADIDGSGEILGLYVCDGAICTPL